MPADHDLPEPDHASATALIPGESLAERVERAGPLRADVVWTIAQQLLEALGLLHAAGTAHGNLTASNIRFPGAARDETALVLVDADDPAAGSDATREDLQQLGATLWFALTGVDPAVPLSWQQLDAAGITPDQGALPVLLARTLAGEPSQRPPTAPALAETLNMLAPLRSMVASSQAMPSRVPAPDHVAPKPRPPVSEEAEWGTRPTGRLPTPNRRRQKSGQFWLPLSLLAVGGVAGFIGGVTYEKSHLSNATPALTAPPLPQATPAPDVLLPPSPPVGAAAAAARLARIKSVQPDVGDILKYARELRRVATLPVPDAANFPAEAQVAHLLERFDWQDPASPNFHRTPLILVLGYSNEHPDAQGQAAALRCADGLAQALAANGITSPIYTCGLGTPDGIPEIETAGTADGKFVEVWVAFTLF